MNKLTQLNQELLQARKEGNIVTKSLLQTLKGEYENSIKNGQEASDESLEKLIRKFIKNAEFVVSTGNPKGMQKAQQEIEILQKYLPKQMSETELRELIQREISNAPDKANNYKLGNKGVIGWFMGSIVKATQGMAEPKMIGKILNEELERH